MKKLVFDKKHQERIKNYRVSKKSLNYLIKILEYKTKIKDIYNNEKAKQKQYFKCSSSSYYWN
jgi:hypothetical protein